MFFVNLYIFHGYRVKRTYENFNKKNMEKNNQFDRFSWNLELRV